MTTMRPFRIHVWRLLLFVIAAACAQAAEPATVFTRLDLADGRTLTNVTVKSYDPASGRVLLIAGRTAMTVPITLIPPPFDTQLKAALPVAGLNLTTVPARPSPLPPASGSPAAPRTSPAPAVRVVRTPSPSPAALEAASAAAHQQAAQSRAARYFRYEFQAGSSAISVYDCNIELEEIEPIAGWAGRYRTTGKAYLQFYDSRGRSFSRTTSRFEVITEQRPGRSVTVVDFTRLGAAR